MYHQRPDGVTIHKGFPNPAADQSLQTLDLNQLLIHNSASTFFMRIDGNTWREQGIFHGDLVIIDRAMSPKRNDLVVWYDSDQFMMSTQNKVTTGTPTWGLITTVVHQYRTKVIHHVQ